MVNRCVKIGNTEKTTHIRKKRAVNYFQLLERGLLWGPYRISQCFLKAPATSCVVVARKGTVLVSFENRPVIANNVALPLFDLRRAPRMSMLT